MAAWNVYSQNGRWLDRGYYSDKCEGGAEITADDVKEGLVNHDRYAPNIIVRKA